MIPEAEAADVPDAIDDLTATVFHQRGFSSSWRSYSNVALTWTAPDDNGDSIERYMVKIYSEQQDKFVLINSASAWIPASHLYYTDDGRGGNKEYSYAVYAKNDEGWSQPSNVVQVLTLPCPAATGNYDYHAYYTSNIIHSTPPTVNVPDDIVRPYSGYAGGTEVNFTVSAIDGIAVCASDPVCTNDNGSAYPATLTDFAGALGQDGAFEYGFPAGTTTVTCTASNAPGHEGTASFTITIVTPDMDTTPPTVNVPSDITVAASSSSGGNAWFDVSAIDDVTYTNQDQNVQYSENLIVTCSSPSGSLFQVGPPTTVTCTASDWVGNEGTETFTVTVTYTEPEVPSEPETPSESDTVPPEVLVPNNIVVPAENPDGKVVSFNPQAVDNIDGLLTPTCNPQSGSLFQIGTTTVTCTATDSAGNTNTNSFTVTILDFDGFVIPDWIRDIAEWWHNDTINDDSFLNAIEYLIQHDVIVVPPTDVETESSPTVPSWFKINAGFWASGEIDDETFVNGLQYLIQIGLIQV